MGSSEELKRTNPSPSEDRKTSTQVEVIHAWSGPRSLSTSLMYSFAQREDTEVLDEPLYAHYLCVSGAQRPYREELLAKMESDGNKVFQDVIMGPCDKKYRYCKHMAKQRTNQLTGHIMETGKHVILIRNPLYSLPSFNSVIPASSDELDLGELVSIYNELKRKGHTPAIIDADDLQGNPESVLRSLCTSLGMPFQTSMLRWDVGGRKEDGLWAPWWYKAVHKSTGFGSPPLYPKKAFPIQLYDVLEECQPFYRMLKRHVLVTTNCQTQTVPDIPIKENERILVWVDREIVPREDAKVSVFDSIVQGGDGVWEGLRVYKGKIFKLEEHLDRLLDSAKALAFENIPTRDEIKRAIFSTLIINGMLDGAHIRMTLTRGKKVTSGMSPVFNMYGCTLIVLAEWKPPVYNNDEGIRLATASTRRNSPNHLDSKIHHNNLLNNILAKVEGNLQGADDAIMLDVDGYVSETNATNLFLVKKGVIFTPCADYCLPGITRRTVIDLAKDKGYSVEECRISISQFHTADEVYSKSQP
ncbi:hypothetical protein GOP47_0008448 [Adiantum capillus-veneris]|uniref:Uncharacterized protein n=1 Tax=Adiantum capillus-veneris TaxID=13818 RepID=A0A9D4UZB7_ADICA|nr:hypothetical protein GOP47_0008448 [Adiantum capillus-veneris]